MSDSSRNLVNAWRKKIGKQVSESAIVQPQQRQISQPLTNASLNMNEEISKKEALQLLEQAYNLIFKAHKLLTQ